MRIIPKAESSTKLDKEYINENTGSPVYVDNEGYIRDYTNSNRYTIQLPEVTKEAYTYRTANDPLGGLEFINEAVFRPMSVLSPTSWIGAARHASDGGNFVRSLFGTEENLGIGGKNWNPYLNMSLNFIGDLVPIGGGISKVSNLNLARKFFNSIDQEKLYNFASRIRDLKVKLNQPIGSNFHYLRYLARKNAKATISDNITLPDGISPNSSEDAVKLTQSRYKYLQQSPDREARRQFLQWDPNYRGISLEGPPKDPWNDTPVIDYLSLKDTYKLLKNDYKSPIVRLFKTPRVYLKLNLNPAFAWGNKFIKMSQKQFSRLRRPDVTEAHERVHILDQNKKGSLTPVGFNYSHLNAGVKDYFTHGGATELKARGNQIKNYFGLTANEPITADMLKYAAKHYPTDVMDNNMNQFFSGIIDWNKAAEWLSKHSLKKGGRLVSKKKNNENNT